MCAYEGLVRVSHVGLGLCENVCLEVAFDIRERRPRSVLRWGRRTLILPIERVVVHLVLRTGGQPLFGGLVRVHLLATDQYFWAVARFFLDDSVLRCGFLVLSKIKKPSVSSLTIASIRTAESSDRFFQQKFFQVGKAANPQQVCCLLSTPVWSCERWTDRVVSWCSCEVSIGTSLS